MLKSSGTKKGYFFKLLISACLLTGLFVSSGEGIRLFPIPSASSASSGNPTTVLQVGSNAKYQLTLLRFANSSKHFASKILKKKNSFGTAAAGRPYITLEPEPSRSSEAQRAFSADTPASLAGMPMLPTGRGPPLS